MGKKIAGYLTEVLTVILIYGCILWLYNVIFRKDSTVDSGLIFQSIVFSILFVAFVRYKKGRKTKDRNDCS